MIDKCPACFYNSPKAMTERDGDTASQRAGGRCEPVRKVPKVLWLLSRRFESPRRRVSRVRRVSAEELLDSERGVGP